MHSTALPYTSEQHYCHHLSSIKTRWMGQESRQTARLINQQEGQRTTWLRSIKFDYQTLSPDALSHFPTAHLGCFLNENSAAESVLGLSVEEESWLADTDADQYPAGKTNTAPDSQGLMWGNGTVSRLRRCVLLKPSNLDGKKE